MLRVFTDRASGLQVFPQYTRDGQLTGDSMIYIEDSEAPGGRIAVTLSQKDLGQLIEFVKVHR